MALDPEPQPSRAQVIRADRGGLANDISSGHEAVLHVPDGPLSVGQGLCLVFPVMAVDLCSSVPSRSELFGPRRGSPRASEGRVTGLAAESPPSPFLGCRLLSSYLSNWKSILF